MIPVEAKIAIVNVTLNLNVKKIKINLVYVGFGGKTLNVQVV